MALTRQQRCRSGSSLSEFLDAYRHEVGLSVHWVLVGPSGRRTRPEAGGVLRHYRRCAGEGRHMVKTVANTFYLSNVASHPHNFEFRCCPSYHRRRAGTAGAAAICLDATWLAHVAHGAHGPREAALKRLDSLPALTHGFA